LTKKKVLNALEIQNSKELGISFLEMMADDLKYFEIAKFQTMNKVEEGAKDLEETLYNLFHNVANK
jgi:hypothetical protein